LDHWINLGDLKNFVPWVSLAAGLSGSLHCLGMCGGLVTSSCHNGQQVVRYQLGRLLGYVLLGLLVGTVGSLFQQIFYNSYISFLPGLLMGSFFIFWGIQSYRGKKINGHSGKIFSKAYQTIWRKFILETNSYLKSFFVGLISILLPCGLLYSIILGAFALQSQKMALGAVFFFWLGTLPSMLLAPNILRKILKPFQNKRPKIYALLLMLIGVVTIGHRVHAQYQLNVQMHDDASVQCHVPQ